LRQHLGVGGDYRQRRIHFVRHARGQQSDRRKFVGLGELDLKLDSLGDVVHDHQPSHHVELAGHQRRDGNVHHARFAVGSHQPKFIKIVDARILPNAVELLDEGSRKNLTQRTPTACQRGWAYMTSICEFQDSMRSCRSTAMTPTLMDSTIFSLKSLRRSYSVTFCSSDAYSRPFWMAMPMYPASASSNSTSSLERKSPCIVLPSPRKAIVFCRAWQGM